MTMNILVTGAKGQLGNELRSVLTTMRAEIGPIPAVYSGANVQYLDADVLDITDASAVEVFLVEQCTDLIINCASFTNVDACETQPDLAYAINADGPRNLARAAQKVAAKLVHISTDYVFSGDNPEPRVETDSCNPQSVYGKSKLLSEEYVAQACDKHFIVRTAWLYGYAGNNFVQTILRLARENGAIKVVDDQIGNPTSANDLAYELLWIAQTEDYGIYHCTNNGICSWFDFASAIVDGAGIPCTKTPCSTDEFPRPAKRPAFSALDNARLRATIGDQMRPWQEALRTSLLRLVEQSSHPAATPEEAALS